MPCVLFCDTETFTKERYHGRDVFRRHFQRGNDSRDEVSDPPSHRRLITIFRGEDHTELHLDPASRQYSVRTSAPDLLEELAAGLYRRPAPHLSGKTLHIYWDVIDAGERRQEFGMTSRHLRIRERFVPDPGACVGEHERVQEGWFGLPSNSTGKPRADRNLISESRLTSGPPCADRIVFHGRPPELGVALHVTISEVAGGREVWSQTTHVLEYSTAQLPDGIFEPPAGFRKVDHVAGESCQSWSGRFLFDWQQIGNAVGSWFK